MIDNRESFANRERFPEADEVHADEYEEVFPKLPINETSYIIIVTRGHRDDMRVLKLGGGDAGALHRHDRQQAQGDRRRASELEKEGIPRAAFEKVHAPMGLDIGAISPGGDRHFGGRGNDRGAPQRARPTGARSRCRYSPTNRSRAAAVK